MYSFSIMSAHNPIRGLAQRCFQGLNDTSQQNGSDYIQAKRQRTLYKNLRNAVKDNNTRMEKRGVAYNATTIIQDCGTTWDSTTPVHNVPVPNGQLASTDSYQTLLDITKGKHLVNPLFAGAEATKYGLWLSQMCEINYLGAWTTGILARHSIPIRGLTTDPAQSSGFPGLQADVSRNNLITFPLPCLPASICTATYGTDMSWNPMAYPGYVIDPNDEIFAPVCTNNTIKAWVRLANPVFTNQPGFWRAVNAQPLNGFKYPSKVSLTDNLQRTDNLTIEAWGPGMVARSGDVPCLDRTKPPQPTILNIPSPPGLPNDTIKQNRIYGFAPRCAQSQYCAGFGKLN